MVNERSADDGMARLPGPAGGFSTYAAPIAPGNFGCRIASLEAMAIQLAARVARLEAEREEKP